MDWYLFKCNNCGWNQAGCYNFEDIPEYRDLLPDTDCPRCRSHDSVLEGQEIPESTARKIIWGIE